VLYIQCSYTSTAVTRVKFESEYLILPYKQLKVNVKVSRNRPGQAQAVPDRSRPRIFLTFGTTMMVGGQPYASAAFTSGEIPGTHF